MKPEKIDYKNLKEAFPQIIKCIFEVNEGWHSLIWDMCEHLLSARKSANIPVSDDYPLTFVQVKEKFGVLRVYAVTSTPEDDQIIEMFEDMSQFVCEVCGDPGRIRGRHWLYTACDYHTNPLDAMS